MNSIERNPFIFVVLLPLLLGATTSAIAQTGVGTSAQLARAASAVPNRSIPLSDYLISRLRATTDGQRDYVREIAQLVEKNKLERRLVLALERYARRKNPHIPLPIYERALRVEAAKRGVAVPTIKQVVARNGVTAARAVQDTRIR